MRVESNESRSFAQDRLAPGGGRLRIGPLGRRRTRPPWFRPKTFGRKPHIVCRATETHQGSTDERGPSLRFLAVTVKNLGIARGVPIGASLNQGLNGAELSAAVFAFKAVNRPALTFKSGDGHERNRVWRHDKRQGFFSTNPKMLPLVGSESPFPHGPAKDVACPSTVPTFGGWRRPEEAAPVVAFKRVTISLSNHKNESRSPLKPRGCAGFRLRPCRVQVVFRSSDDRNTQPKPLRSSAPGGCPASCRIVPHRPTHGHRHVRK